MFENEDKFKKDDKKGWIRGTAFLLVVLALIAGAGIYQYTRAQNYKTQMENGYQRAFYDFVDYVKKVDASLEKGIHSSSPTQMALISNEIWRQSQGAKSALGQLPLNETSMEKMEKFLSQVGDYSYTLSKKVIYQDAITTEEQGNLENLSTYAKKLTQALMNMEGKVNENNLEISALNVAIEKAGESQQGKMGGFGEIEKQFSEYPTLIYDGPFSDHVEKKEAALLNKSGEVSEAQAKEKASKLVGIPASQLKSNTGSKGRIYTYSFEGKDKNGGITAAEITKAGGYPLYMMSGRKIDTAKIPHEEAIEKAKKFLTDNGFGSMRQSYYIENGGILYINFAYTDGTYIYYPDLIEVGIALDNGEAVFMQSRGYIMNHKKRDIPAVKVSRETAQASINTRLKAEQYSLAVIPTDSGGEKFVHAFRCVNKDGRRYMVFINTVTGREEDILMIVESDNGTLTM